MTKTELIKTVGTDISGKWIQIDKAEKLIDLVLKECSNVIMETRYDKRNGFVTQAFPEYIIAQLYKHFEEKK